MDMMKEIDEGTKMRIQKLTLDLNESQKRKFLALEANALGRGGITAVSAISGVHRNTISAGLKELKEEEEGIIKSEKEKARVRAKGGGRKAITVTQPGIVEALERLVEPTSYGNPENPLRWTTKSLRNLADELQAEGFNIKYRKVGYLLKELGFSLQQNKKMMQAGEPSPDRDQQFQHINDTAKEYLSCGDPVISVDCKKKENVGNFKNNGAEYAPISSPVEVLDHDFALPENGKAAPYGVYDIFNNEGYVNIGISADTAMFAVNSIRNWWYHMGAERFPDAKRIFITADGGGSNGCRCKLWKTELQKLANELHLVIEVSHFPLGTSKWNKIEHRMFSQISKNWRAKPLVSLAVIVSLISSTTTDSGLQIKCGVDSNLYKTRIKVSDFELANVNIVKNDFCGNWNYTIFPNS